MDSQKYIELGTMFVAMSGIIVPAIWHLSTKIQKIDGSVTSLRADLGSKLEALESQLAGVQMEIKESRKARAEIWREVNSLRERARAIEVRVEK